MQFLLGTHRTEWVTTQALPLFISAIQMRRRPIAKKRPTATCDWALDSGGFTELSTHGRWTVTPQHYADEVRRWRDTHGRLLWAAVQDWMCEPFITAKTGLTVLDHQMHTVQNWLDLNDLAPEVPWVPVLQGWEHEQYLHHVYLYQRYAGVDVAALPRVGVGSICRREDTSEAEDIIRDLAGLGIKIHGFGFKIDGLARVSSFLSSADSLAWSDRARHYRDKQGNKAPMLESCKTRWKHATCTNCYDWAVAWREKVLNSVRSGIVVSRQLRLF